VPLSGPPPACTESNLLLRARSHSAERPPRRRLSVFNGTYAIRKVENDCFLGIYACVPFSSSAWCALRAALINDMMARRNIQVPINQYFCFTAHVAEIKKDA